MTNEQLIEKFNPANSGALAAEDLELLRGLSDAQIDVLADAYPNKPTRRAYLRLYDTSLQPNKQLYQLSTWQNLRNVRKFSNKKNLIPYDFSATPASLTRQQMAAKPAQQKGNVKQVLVDLSATEAAAELTKTLTAKGNITSKPPAPKNETPKTNKTSKAENAKVEKPAAENTNIPEDQQMANI